MNASDGRLRGRVGRILLVAVVCVALLGTLVTPGFAATPTVQGSAYAHLKRFMTDFDKAGFSKVVDIGSLTIYRTTLSSITIKVDTSLKAVAKYDPNTNTITFSKDPRKVKSSQSLAFGETVWHELTHAIEDAHGDIGFFDNAAYAERNIDYMTHIVRVALPLLERMESKAKGGSKAATLEKYWRLFIKQVEAAAALESTKKYPPNFEIMREWFGFKVYPDQIKDTYLTDKAFSSKKWAQLRKALKGEPLSWTGEWETNWGSMSLSQSGTAVTGAYTHDSGKISATASGLTITGRWSEYPSYTGPRDAGTISFTLSDDGDTFAGTWTYDGGGGGDWSGTRKW
jgi:hypothetical protein